jgi:hypothetical protein
MKSSLNGSEALRKVLEELEIEYPKFPCPVGYYGNVVELKTCVIRCSVPCRVFNNFQYAVTGCDDDLCDELSPCIECTERIEKYKVLINCIRAIFHSGRPDKRYKPGCLELNIEIHNRRIVNARKTNKEIKEFKEAYED